MAYGSADCLLGIVHHETLARSASLSPPTVPDRHQTVCKRPRPFLSL